MIQAIQCVLHCSKEGKSPQTQQEPHSIDDINSECHESRSQEHRHSCDCVQVSLPDLTSPLVWTNSCQTLGIFSLKCEDFPYEKRSFLGDEAWGTVKSKNIPSPKHKHMIKIHETGDTAEWMKIPRL